MIYTRHKIILLIACIISLQACYGTHDNRTGWFDSFLNFFGTTYNACINNNLFIQQKGNSITISDTKNMKNPKNIQLTGITKRLSPTLKIDSVSLPSFVQVIIDNSVNSSIEGDAAIFDSGLAFVVENGKLGLVLKKNTCLKFNGTGDKPLCTITVNLSSNSLHVDGVTPVILKQAPLHTLTVNGASKVHTVHNNSPTTTNSTISSKIPLQTLNVSGNSIVDMSDIETTNLQTTISGANNVTLSGTADTQTVDIDGTSKYNTQHLKSKKIAIDASGAWLMLQIF